MVKVSSVAVFLLPLFIQQIATLAIDRSVIDTAPAQDLLPSGDLASDHARAFAKRTPTNPDDRLPPNPTPKDAAAQQARMQGQDPGQRPGAWADVPYNPQGAGTGSDAATAAGSIYHGFQTRPPPPPPAPGNTPFRPTTPLNFDGTNTQALDAHNQRVEGTTPGNFPGPFSNIPRPDETLRQYPPSAAGTVGTAPAAPAPGLGRTPTFPPPAGGPAGPRAAPPPRSPNRRPTYPLQPVPEGRPAGDRPAPPPRTPSPRKDSQLQRPPTGPPGGPRDRQAR